MRPRRRRTAGARAPRSFASAAPSWCWNSGFVASGLARAMAPCRRRERGCPPAPPARCRRDAGDPEGEDRRHRDPQQRLVQARRVRERQDTCARPGRTRCRRRSGGCRCRTSPSTDQVSSILIWSGENTHRAQLGAAAGVLHAVAEQPVAVLAAAGERPPAAHPVPPVDGHGRPGRTEDAADDDVGTLGVEGVERRPGKAAQIDPPARQIHRRPGRPTRPPGSAPRSRSSRSPDRSPPPPWLRGTSMRKHPAAVRSRTRSRATAAPPRSRRPRAAIFGARPRTASSTDGLSGHLWIGRSRHGGSPFGFAPPGDSVGRRSAGHPHRPFEPNFGGRRAWYVRTTRRVRPGRAGTRTRWRRRATTPRSC